MINVREWSHDDYPELERWWNTHGWPGVPLSRLPQCGIVVEIDDVPKAAVWAYMDHSTPFALVEWLVTNPDNKAAESVEAIKHAGAEIMRLCKLFGRTDLMTTSSHPLLIKLFERMGFKKTDEQMTHLIYTGGE